MGLVLAYDFDHKLDLLRQHFPCSDKIILSTHFFVFLKVPYSSYEKKMIIINMKKQSSHIAYITSSAFYVFCDLYFYYVSSEHQYTYTSIVNSPLQCTFLQMFYAANLCHTCLVPTPFKIYHQSASEKSRYCHSKILKFFHCNRNCESSSRFKLSQTQDWLSHLGAKGSFLVEFYF